MAKKEDVTTPEVDVIPTDTGATDQPEPAEPQPEIPEEYKGKSPEDLARMLVETKERLGKQGKDMGEKVKDLEDRLEAYRQEADDERRMYEMYKQPEGPQPTSPPPAEEKPTFDYEKPFQSIESYLKQRDAKMQQQAQQNQVQMARTEGQNAFQQTRKLAYQQNPELYQGIERDVEQRMYQTYAPYANMGMSVKEYVGDPKIWERCAQNVRLEQGGYELVPKKPQPMKAVETETPTPARPAWGDIPGQFDLDVQGDPEMQAWMRVMKREGVATTPEERKEILKTEQERLLRGEK